MNEHIVSSYDDELNKLQTLIMTMGTTATEMVDNAVDALLNADKESARTIIDTDRAINAGLSRLTELSQNILALRSPMANDLRKVLSAIQVGLNIERVGDLAKNMARLHTSTQSPPVAVAYSIKKITLIKPRTTTSPNIKEYNK